MYLLNLCYKEKIIINILLIIFMFHGCKNVDVEKPWNEGENLSLYIVTRTTSSIKIDGKLDELDWKNAVEAPLKNTLNGEEVPLKTTVKFLWDDIYLYVGFYCEDPDAWANYTKEDDKLWEEEVVELFIDPDCNGFNYYEHEINPINVKVDLYVSNAGRERKGRIKGWFEWDFEHIISEVYVEGDGEKSGTNDVYWTVEVGVPFEDLWEMNHIPPKDGDIWRLGAYRIERGKPEDKSDDWSAAFSPTFRSSFHTPWQFGKLIFKK